MTKDITQISAFLLEQSKETIRRFEESYKQSGEKYNIFKIANISTDEVKPVELLEIYLILMVIIIKVIIF